MSQGEADLLKPLAAQRLDPVGMRKFLLSEKAKLMKNLWMSNDMQFKIEPRISTSG